MISVSRTFFWSWRPSARLLHFGLDVWVPGLKIRIGHDGPPCRVCRKREGILTWPLDNPGAAICPNCCDHDYERCDGDFFCVECGEEAPYEWVADYYRSDDDVCISFAGAREPGEPIGTPISELSGRPGYPGFEKFKQIAKSWGHD